MAESPDELVLYRVVYSERVRIALSKLLMLARNHGLGIQVLEAVKEMDRRLHIYPQFGQPLRDLVLELSASAWSAHGRSLPGLVRR